MKCDINGCTDPMDEYMIVSCEIPPVRHEFATLELGGGLHKEVRLDDQPATFQLNVCLPHGARIHKLREAGKRAAIPVSTFGPLRRADGD